MKITKDNATFFQNKFNYYVGSIETDETIYIEDNFIIIGNIKTSKNILAKDNVIVIGNIKALSIYMCKDICCMGRIKS